MELTNFAKNIRFLRTRRGWTQSEMPDRCGIKQTRWSSWENDAASPDFNNLIAISDLFAVPIDLLMRIDLEKNLHLIEKSGELVELLKSTSKSTGNTTSNDGNEPETEYLKAKKETDLLILRQLNTLVDKVDEINAKLPPA